MAVVEVIPLSWLLIVAGALFCIGLFGALARRNVVSILMGVELMLNSVNINLVAFWRYLEPGTASVTGQVFALFIISVAAAEAVVGLAMVIAIYRTRATVLADEVDSLKG